MGCTSICRLDRHADRVFEARAPVSGHRPDIRWRSSLFALSRRGFWKGFGKKERRAVTCSEDRYHLRRTWDPIETTFCSDAIRRSEFLRF